MKSTVINAVAVVLALALSFLLFDALKQVRERDAAIVELRAELDAAGVHLATAIRDRDGWHALHDKWSAKSQARYLEQERVIEDLRAMVLRLSK